MTRRIVVVRHGRTAHNADGRVQGQLDTALDDVGRAQAAAAAGGIAGFGASVLVSSDLARAADTAAPLAHECGLEVRLDKRLREIDMGAWSGLTLDEARVAFPDEYAQWMAGADTSRGGGETFTQVADRAVASVTEHLADVADGGSLVVVTHGGTSRALTGRLLDLPWALNWRFGPLGNAHRSVLLETQRGWRLAEYNVGPGF